MPRKHVKREFSKMKGEPSFNGFRKSAGDIDDEFIRLTAPIGGISYHPEFIRKGDGYETCIYVQGFSESVNAGWLNRFKLNNVMMSLHIYPEDTMEIEKKIEKSMNEQLSRQFDSNTSTIDKIKAGNRAGQLKELVDEIDLNAEVIFKLALRIYLFEPTWVELEEKRKTILREISQNKATGTILINEQDNEFRSLFRSSDRDVLYRRHGTGMPAITVGAGFPFSFSQLNDPRGLLLGMTDDGGALNLDLFYKTDTRAYYNASIFGTMGSGKSTTIKKLMKHFAIVGHRIRSLDPVGETADLARQFGGKVISLDGTGEVLNPLDWDGKEGSSLAKAEAFLGYICPDLTSHELAIFSKLLRMAYQSLLPKRINPIFSHVARIIKKFLEENRMPEHRKELANLDIQIDRLITSYGDLFNKPSTINTKDEAIVVYTLRGLTSFGKEVYQAQMFNILSLLWKELVAFGSVQKELYEKGLMTIEQVEFFALFGDEFHQFLNSKNLKGVEFLVMVAREARKYFAGLIWATQSIRDAVSTSSEAISEMVKTLFELTQYKFIMKQDANAIDHISNIFNNQMTYSELDQIPYFKTGECLLNISGDSNYKFWVHADEEELELFAGGV